MSAAAQEQARMAAFHELDPRYRWFKTAIGTQCCELDALSSTGAP
jgi:hypothetical protein